MEWPGTCFLPSHSSLGFPEPAFEAVTSRLPGNEWVPDTPGASVLLGSTRRDPCRDELEALSLGSHPLAGGVVGQGRDAAPEISWV